MTYADISKHAHLKKLGYGHLSVPNNF